MPMARLAIHANMICSRNYALYHANIRIRHVICTAMHLANLNTKRRQHEDIRVCIRYALEYRMQLVIESHSENKVTHVDFALGCQ